VSATGQGEAVSCSKFILWSVISLITWFSFFGCLATVLPDGLIFLLALPGIVLVPAFVGYLMVKEERAVAARRSGRNQF
jgi:hypothetical protein